ncbi:MAG TPA: hypothetical protein VNL35_05205 [Chloroflexota bacterium]|nr:hypothetical protein [Chloroflexota bacterium]
MRVNGKAYSITVMNVRPARLSDFPTVRTLSRIGPATVLAPPVASNVPSALTLTAISHWRGIGARSHTLLLGGANRTRGFIQARARPGRESWDIVRLSCRSQDPEHRGQGCADLVERICTDMAERGALRTFARLPEDSDSLALMAEHSFRPFSTEITLRGLPCTAIDSAPHPRPDVRVRDPRDAWDIFSLYCATTPALVRHSESRSLKEWSPVDRIPTRLVRRWRPVHEVVVGEMGNLQAWLRWRPAYDSRAQLLEVLAGSEAATRVPEMLRFAAEHLGLDVNCATICRVREYDGRISATLEEAGFEPILREILLVRHTVAWVTERQLLVAALRAQGLGLELSQYRRGGVKEVHQRMASSREAQHHYDRDDGASNYG